jgi:hypothetical protein
MEQINVKVRQAENTLQALDIASRLRGCPFELLDPARSLIFQGSVSQSIYSNKLGSYEIVERHLILFNDCAVLAKKARTTWKNKDLRIFYVDALVFEDGIELIIPAEDTSCFEILKTSSNCTWRLQSDQRSTWISFLQKCGIQEQPK